MFANMSEAKRKGFILPVRLHITLDGWKIRKPDDLGRMDDYDGLENAAGEVVLSDWHSAEPCYKPIGQIGLT